MLLGLQLGDELVHFVQWAIDGFLNARLQLLLLLLEVVDLLQDE